MNYNQILTILYKLKNNVKEGKQKTNKINNKSF